MQARTGYPSEVQAQVNSLHADTQHTYWRAFQEIRIDRRGKRTGVEEVQGDSEPRFSPFIPLSAQNYISSGLVEHLVEQVQFQLR